MLTCILTVDPDIDPQKDRKTDRCHQAGCKELVRAFKIQNGKYKSRHIQENKKYDTDQSSNLSGTPGVRICDFIFMRLFHDAVSLLFVFIQNKYSIERTILYNFLLKSFYFQ